MIVPLMVSVHGIWLLFSCWICVQECT
uniref:Uncharacterized protein n=1 Tax=Arundo donax TaxID=35708 RepID=A0A0A9CZR7_ARUDO